MRTARRSCAAIDDFIDATDGDDRSLRLCLVREGRTVRQGSRAVAQPRAETLELLIKSRLSAAASRAVNIEDAYSHEADKDDPDKTVTSDFRVAIARAVKQGITNQRNATAVLVPRDADAGSAGGRASAGGL